MAKDRDRDAGAPEVSPRAARLAEELHVPAGVLSGSGPGGRIEDADVERYDAELAGRRITPSARRLAAVRGVDLREAAGSGDGGRITRADVERAAGGGAEMKIELSEAQRLFAEHFAREGPRMIPRIELRGSVDGSAVLRRVEDARKRGRSLALSDVIVAAAARAAMEAPEVRDRWRGDRIMRAAGLDVVLFTGDAAASIRGADRLTLEEIAELRMAADARDGEASATMAIHICDADVLCAPLLPGQAAALGVGAVRDRVVVEDGAMTVRPTLEITLVADARLVSTDAGAAYLSRVKDLLEQADVLER